MRQSTLIFVLFILMVSCGGTTEKKTAAELPEKIIDRIALTDLEGQAIDLAELKGKTIFLNFWATWCRPCIAEMPDIDEASEILSNEDFVFLAASDESLEKIKKYVDQVDYSFQFVRSETSVFDLEIMALPTTMIINKDGEIIYNEVGARKWNSDTEVEKLRKIANQ